jgi:general secretion pathway protein J
VALNSASSPPAAGQQSGFTLIEVLITLVILALMSLMSWRGISAMSANLDSLTQRSNQTHAVSNTLAQWRSDLDHMTDAAGAPAWDWDGKTLRITRLADQVGTLAAQVSVVAWTVHRSPDDPTALMWRRWRSATFTTHAAWEFAWQQAQRWGQSQLDAQGGADVALFPVEAFQIYIYRGNSWTNPLSTGERQSSVATPAGSDQDKVPDGVRLSLGMSAASGVPGTITLDWVRPTLSMNRQ